MSEMREERGRETFEWKKVGETEEKRRECVSERHVTILHISQVLARKKFRSERETRHLERIKTILREVLRGRDAFWCALSVFERGLCGEGDANHCIKTVCVRMHGTQSRFASLAFAVHNPTPEV